MDTNAFDRIVVASFQPDKRRAAKQLASAVVKALANTSDREGVLVVQLDELLAGEDALLDGVPFLPSEPVAVCITGTPRLVARISGGMSSATKARFARARAEMAPSCLRIALFANDGKLTLDTNREFAGAAHALAKAQWHVVPVGEEEDFELFQAQQVLNALASRPPSPSVSPEPANVKKESSGVPESEQRVRGKGRAMLKKKPTALGAAARRCYESCTAIRLPKLSATPGPASSFLADAASCLVSPIGVARNVTTRGLKNRRS
jgi:hypothetical protein